MKKQIKVGIIGTGGISHFHAQGYKQLEHVDLYAVCDLNEERAKAFAEKYGVQRVYTSYDEMLALSELEAVSVCTWNNAHASASIAALKAGKHVLCEKPMAMNTREALNMAKAAEEAGKLLMVGFVRRFGRDESIVKDFISSGQLGDIYYAKASYLRRCGNPGGWFSDIQRSGGGALIDLGVHVIDLVRYLMGKPKVVSVTGVTFNNIGSRGHIKGFDRYKASDYSEFSNVEDMAAALIRFDNGAILNVETSFSLNIKEDSGNIELFGTKSGIKMDPKLEIFTEMENYLVDITPRISQDADRFSKIFSNETAHFVDCVMNGTECLTPAADGVELMRILDAVYESSRTGREVIIER
jgi:predicted dehydrogenase